MQISQKQIYYYYGRSKEVACIQLWISIEKCSTTELILIRIMDYQYVKRSLDQQLELQASVHCLLHGLQHGAFQQWE